MILHSDSFHEEQLVCINQRVLTRTSVAGQTADYVHIQLFRETLSDKVHATTPKGIVGGFEFTLFQRNLKEWQERSWTYVCEC